MFLFEIGTMPYMDEYVESYINNINVSRAFYVLWFQVSFHLDRIVFYKWKYMYAHILYILNVAIEYHPKSISSIFCKIHDDFCTFSNIGISLAAITWIKLKWITISAA